MRRSAMTLLMIFAFALGFAVPASALTLANASAACADMAATDARDMPAPPCCDFSCAISLSTCGLCARIVTAEVSQIRPIAAVALGFNATRQLGLTNAVMPPDPPPPRNLRQ